MKKLVVAFAILVLTPFESKANVFESVYYQAQAFLAQFFPISPNWSVYRDIQYGVTTEEKADLYLLPGANRPAVVFIHGGGWTAGDKSTYASYYAKKYGASGFSVISINYRLAKPANPSSQWPAQLQDVQMAMRWIKASAPYWGIDPNRICVFGDSAGAHLAMFLGSLKTSRPGDRSQYYANQSPSAACVVEMFGPTDLTDPQQLTTLNGAQLFGGKTYEQAPALYADASPIRYVTPQTAPTLLIQGYWDTIVFPAQAANYANKLISNNVRTLLIPFYGGHWFQYLNPSSQKDQIDNQAVQFVTNILRPY